MQKAGFIGPGIMGKPIAANLLRNGVALATFTPSRKAWDHSKIDRTLEVLANHESGQQTA